MKTGMTLAEIAALVGGEVRGDAQCAVVGVATIESAGPSDLTWLTDPTRAYRLAQCRASAVLLNAATPAVAMPAVACGDVERALVDVLAALGPALPAVPAGVDPSARIAPTAVLGDGVRIGPFVIVADGAHIGPRTSLHSGVSIGPDSVVGADCCLWPNVVVRDRCSLGDRVTIQAGSVIGSDGFGYIFRDGQHLKLPHVGRVLIGDDVEIGSCSCVDRAKVGCTVVGPGTKIDNLVQVAHNVQIGAHCLLCAQVGVAGSSKLGDGVVLGGQSGIRDNIVLHSGVMVAACSCVPQDVAAGGKVAGIPAVDVRQFLRESVGLRKLPGLLSQVRELLKRVEKLEAAADHKPDG